jgi:ribonuclease D
MVEATFNSALLNQPATLQSVLKAASRASEIALDTEADSMHAYPEKVCLIQIRIGKQSWLLDPLLDMDLGPLMEVFARKSLLFHAADYDLRLLFRRYGLRPASIFDTMWAARMVGHERFGLEYMVKHYFGIQLEKGPQTANWGLRPLTPVMETYAFNDVLHLSPLADLLRKRLIELGRLSWVEQICERVIQQACEPEQDLSDTQWRLKGSHRLGRRGLGYLRSIWSWREQEAVASNRPPFFILSHDTAVAMAEKAATGGGWREMIPRRMAVRRRKALEKAVKEAESLPTTSLPERLKIKRHRATDAEKAKADQLKTVRDRAAKKLGLDPSLIASRATLTRLGLEDGLARTELMAWQRQLLELD